VCQSILSLVIKLTQVKYQLFLFLQEGYVETGSITCFGSQNNTTDKLNNFEGSIIGKI